MTTDFRALCVELTDCLEKSDWPRQYKPVFEQWIYIARKALAEPEPEVPTDEELLQVFDTACLSEGGTVDEIHLRGLHAVLARWGS